MTSLPATNLSSRFDDGNGLKWELSFNTSYGGLPIYLTAAFDSTYEGDATDPFDDATYYDNGTTQHGGSPFRSLSMQIVPIPGAVWLLGGGLIGLVTVRRRRTRQGKYFFIEDRFF